jgi:hypothetical protein
MAPLLTNFGLPSSADFGESGATARRAPCGPSSSTAIFFFAGVSAALKNSGVRPLIRNWWFR